MPATKGCFLLASWLLVLSVAVTVPPSDDFNDINILHEETVRHVNKGANSHALLSQTFKSPRSRSRIRGRSRNPVPNPLSDDSFYYMEMRPQYSNIYGDFPGVERHYPSQPGYEIHEYDMDEDRVRFLCLVLGICGSIFAAAPGKSSLNVFYEWKQLEFEYPNEHERRADLQSGYWIPSVAAPIDVDVHYGNGHGTNRIFVTIPRFQVGSPVTLGEITDKRVDGNPVIRPFPSWSWHKNPTQCHHDRLVSVYRVKIDECGRLWVLDTGKYGDQQTCPPQILAFDLATNKLVHRFTIPGHLLESRSILVTPVVDVRDGCENTFVYVADCQTYAIIVYDVMTGRSWRAIDKTMYPHPEYGTFKIQGEQFDLMDGVLGMALEPYIPGRDRKLFYHAMSSPSQSWMYTSDLRNETRFAEDPSSSPEIYHMFKSKRSSQSCAMAIDRSGISYFGLMSDTTINCWNTGNPDYGNYISTIKKDPVTLQFASGVKVVTNKYNAQELFFLTSRFQKVATGTLNTNEINFRIHAGKIPEITKGTSCRNKPFEINNPNNDFVFKPVTTGGYGFLGKSSTRS